MKLWCLIAFVFLVSCGESTEQGSGSPVEAQGEFKEAEKPQPKDANIVLEAKKEEVKPVLSDLVFKSEITEWGVYDSGLHNIKLPKGIEDSLPGPRLYIKGKLLNSTQHLIHRGGVFGYLEGCVSGHCVERPSHGRGFLVPLSGVKPWRPGTWREFLVVTRPLNPVYRELNDVTFKGKLTLRARSATGLQHNKDFWSEENNSTLWKGKPVLRTLVVQDNDKSAKRKVKLGEEVKVLAMTPLRIALRQKKGKTFWMNRSSLPEFDGRSNVPESRSVTVESIDFGLKDSKFLTVKDKEDREKRLLAVRVELLNHSGKAQKFSPRELVLLRGDENTVTALQKGVPEDFWKGSISLDPDERIDIWTAFPLPYGVEPLVVSMRHKILKADIAAP